jgi:hypothetical protein
MEISAVRILVAPALRNAAFTSVRPSIVDQPGGLQAVLSSTGAQVLAPEDPFCNSFARTFLFSI